LVESRKTNKKWRAVVVFTFLYIKDSAATYQSIAAKQLQGKNTMPIHHRDLTNAQWSSLDGLIPETTCREDGREFPNAILVPDLPIADFTNGSALE
jgi:hypothetical protein